MADHSIFGMNLMAIGGQLAQAWQSMLEAWWTGLLGDPTRLRELAKKLADVSGKDQQDLSGDLSRIVKALELMEARQKGLEAKVEELSSSLDAVVSYLERLQIRQPDEEIKAD